MLLHLKLSDQLVPNVRDTLRSCCKWSARSCHTGKLVKQQELFCAYKTESCNTSCEKVELCPRNYYKAQSHCLEPALKFKTQSLNELSKYSELHKTCSSDCGQALRTKIMFNNFHAVGTNGLLIVIVHSIH